MSWKDGSDRRRKRSPFKDWLFKDINRMFREMERMMDEAFRDLEENKISSRSKPLVWGYSIRIGSDGKPEIREFGNLKFSGHEGSRRSPFYIKEEVEPLVDVMDEGDKIRVVAEVPGVEKDDINLDVKPDALTIDVDAGDRKYYKELRLPSEVDPESIKSNYKNGVLKIILRKASKKLRGVRIKVE